MASIVPADGAILQRIVAATPLVSHHGLSRDASMKFDAAQAKTVMPPGMARIWRSSSKPRTYWRNDVF